ncbi:uncharacterized protein LOC135468322 isoform X2 [Liolophura sinensis]
MTLYRSEVQRDEGSVDEDEMKVVHNRLLKNLTYGDIGKLSFGNPGLVLVNMCLLFTQFGFCVSYFIFIGNTFYTLFPTHNVTQTNSSIYNTSALPTFLNPVDPLEETGSLTRQTYEDVDAEYFYSSNIVGNSSASNLTQDWSFISVSSAPRLEYLILVPLPFFVMFAIIRKIRHLGVISILADVSIFVGCVCVFVYLLIRFTISDTYKLVKASTFPIFFGGVTGAFEGIGTIIPIESSMEGNRHNFPFFLHAAVFLLSFILSVFGILGYLRFGEFAEQMINSNIRPLESPISRIVNVTLCLGILLTFPLQMYPVIELAEGYTFAEGRCCGPSSHRDHYERELSREDDNAIMNEEDEALLSTVDSVSMPVAVEIPDSVPSWKRNIFRVCLVMLACGVAILCRNFYAYFAAFIGAVGSTMLAYILPCIFHLKLAGFRLSRGIWVKNMLIVLIGICGGVMSVYAVIRDVILTFDKS